MYVEFKAVDWAHTTNIYEVNLRQYTAEGTFNAFARHLPRLKEMGVQTLWFMPVQPVGIEKRKGVLGSYYSIKDYSAINPEYGNADNFKELINEAHRYGFKIIIDWVANHTSWDNVWTKTNPGFFSRDDNGNFCPPFPDWEDVIHLDYNNKQLWTAMIDIMKFWVNEFHIDGFRCDMAHLVKLDFWKEVRKELDIIKPLFWLGELDELDHPEYGQVFDISYSWTWMHATEEFYKKQLPLDTLYTVLKNYDDLGDDTMRAWFTSNHDENSWNGTEYEKYGDMAKALAVFSATWNGIPLIYSGQELPNLKRIRFFEKDSIEWKKNASLHDFYKVLLSLHKNNTALRAGDPVVQTFRISTTESKYIVAYLRKNADKEVLVILNFSRDQLAVEITGEEINGTYKNVFSDAELNFNDRQILEMAAWEYLVLEK